MSKIVLHAKTNPARTECTTDLRYSKEEWEAMSEEEQGGIINETMANIVELWVTEDKEGE